MKQINNIFNDRLIKSCRLIAPTNLEYQTISFRWQVNYWEPVNWILASCKAKKVFYPVIK